MKLLEQVSMWCREGNADKVYEVDLCEVAAGRYVVNFRYGRRGGNLKDGTKTATPIDRTAADNLFNALVNEKKKGGYRETGRYSAAGTTAPAATAAPATTVRPADYGDKKDFVLAKLREALQPGFNDKKWPISRIVWRVGELRIAAAVPELTKFALKADALQQYCICWALGRCGDRMAVPLLEQLAQAPASKDFVKRIASAALLELADDSRKGILLDEIFRKLPVALQRAVQFGQADEVQTAFNAGIAEFLDRFSKTLSPDTQRAVQSGKANLEHLAFGAKNAQNPFTYEVLEQLYLLADAYPNVRPTVLSCLQALPLQPNVFKYVRHIYKIAEFREDAEVWGIAAYRFEKAPAYFRRNYWGDWAYLPGDGYNYVENASKEMEKPNSRLAFSNKTRDYFKRRVLRTLQQLGEDQHSDSYTKLATACLLSYSDEKDRTEARQENYTWYEWNSRNYRTRVMHYPAFAGCNNLLQILSRNSTRIELKKNTSLWRFRDGQEKQQVPQSREEAFPELWDKHPEKLMELLRLSRCEPVHQFAVRAYKAQPRWRELADKTFAAALIGSDYDATVQLGLELIGQFYDPQNPDIELIALLAEKPKPFARDMAKQWVTAQPDYFAQKTLLFADLMLNPHEDVARWVDETLGKVRFPEEQAQMVIVKVISGLMELKADNETDLSRSVYACEHLLSHFAGLLRDVNLEIPQELLKHPLPPVQVLGAGILLNHVTPPEQLPPGLVASLVASDEPTVRSVGVQIFGKLPETQLLASQDILLAFCTSPHAEIRAAIRPTIEKLAAKNADFGKSLVVQLVPILQQKEAAAGIHEDILQLLDGALRNSLTVVSTDDVWIMIGSRRVTTQRAGFIVLKNTVSPNDLTVRQLIKLANAEVLDIREYAWAAYNQQVARMKYEASEALRMLDCKWDDSRRFGFQYFRQHFTDSDWTPTLLVSVCDSTRPDVQQFGKEMIMKFFRDENGSDYLLQLSQHPSPGLQTFATNYLEQYATDNYPNLEKLELYFVTVLAQVNKSGLAKQRVFDLLHTEALKTEQTAALVGRIVARQSATMAVGGKAACIRIMRDIRKKYPSIELPLTLKETAAV